MSGTQQRIEVTLKSFGTDGRQRAEALIVLKIFQLLYFVKFCANGEQKKLFWTPRVI